jgi:hypothetical protein
MNFVIFERHKTMDRQPLYSLHVSEMQQSSFNEYL